MNEKSKTYSEIRKELKTGDLVLFSNNTKFGFLIRLSTFSDWTHVGVVYRMRLPGAETDSVYIFESRKQGDTPDQETQKVKAGVQLVMLSERIKNFRGEKIAIRPLLKDGAPPMDTSALTEKVTELRIELKNRPYEKDIFALMNAVVDIGFSEYGEEDLSSLFCSELVAETYQRIGALDDKLPSDEYHPADFSVKRSKNLDWMNGWSLGNQIKLKI